MEERWDPEDRVDTSFKLNVKGTTNFGVVSLTGCITSEAGPDTGQSLLHTQLKSHSTVVLCIDSDCYGLWGRH